MNRNHATRETHMRTQCTTEGCKRFAVNKLPIVGEKITKCKHCTPAVAPEAYPRPKQQAKKQNTVAECGVCCEDAELVKMDVCTHSVCKDCLTKIKETSNKCPFCRAHLAKPAVQLKRNRDRSRSRDRSIDPHYVRQVQGTDRLQGLNYFFFEGGHEEQEEQQEIDEVVFVRMIRRPLYRRQQIFHVGNTWTTFF
jgi:hypothetical protein